MSEIPHIFTLTGNLLAERTWEFDGWKPGATHRAKTETFQVGGKGINVSKMLKRLGAPTTALAFAGGATGAECIGWLRERSFPCRIFPNTTATRQGIVLRSRGVPETTFFSPDVAPDVDALRACAEFLDAQPTGSVLAISGSLPGWESPGFDVLRAAIRRWPGRGTLVVDTYGPPLVWLADQGTALVRVNRTELESLFTAAENKCSSGELLRLARDRFAALRWVATDGGAPVWLADEHNEPECFPPPRVRQVSSTGSGDVMLACMLQARYRHGLSWRDALIWSLLYAAANAAHSGVAEFPDPE